MKIAINHVPALFAMVLMMAQAQAHTPANVPLVPHKAEYKVKISGVSGKLQTELQRTEDGFVAHHVIRATGLVKILARGKMDVTSNFAVDSDGVRPERYAALDTIRDDPTINLQFDWDTNTVDGTVGNDDVSLQLAGLSYDQVSIQYALMHDLLNEDVESEYVLFDIDKMKVAKVTNVGTKSIKTRAGKYTAVGIQHQKMGSSRVTTLWCVEELGYLPAIIEQHKGDRLKFRATLSSYVPSPDKSTAALSEAARP